MSMPDRRRFLQALSSLPLVGGVLSSPAPLRAAVKRDLLKELGVRPLINAAGSYTFLTASLMPPEAVQAWEYGTKHYVRLDDLHDAVGRRVAGMLGAEAAMITAGAASALTLGTAACLTGKNPEFIQRLPDITGMKSEYIIQKSHHFGYEHAVRNCGIRPVDVETRDELESAISDRTALMLFLCKNENMGKIGSAEFAELGRKHNVPTFIDCAADVPPADNLTKFIKLGFSLVTFSGGKGIRGPQSTGLLYGRKDLIEAARLNTSPNSDTIGRGMKVNKEEMLAMLVALEVYFKRDHQADWREWEKRVKLIADSLASVRGIKTEIYVPEIANAVPHLRITWDQSVVKIAPEEAAKRLREGEPSIEVVPDYKEKLDVASWTLQPGEARIVARRIREVLKQAT
jgi:L-seryl-tRNA(Ser) seleniumtransferase